MLLITKMKVIAMAEVYLHDLSLRRAMDADRFFSLVGLSLILFRWLPALDPTECVYTSEQ